MLKLLKYYDRKNVVAEIPRYSYFPATGKLQKITQEYKDLLFP